MLTLLTRSAPLALLMLSLLLWLPPAAWAQTPSVGEMINNADEVDTSNYGKKVIEKGDVTPLKLQVQWKLFDQEMRQGRSGKTAVEGLRESAYSLGWPNLSTYALAGTKLVKRHHDQGNISPDVAMESLGALKTLTPQMPHVHLLRARFGLLNTPTKVDQYALDFYQGIKRYMFWEDTEHPFQFNLIRTTLLALLLAGVLFTLAQLYRYFSICAFDLSRLASSVLSTNQASLLLLLLIVVPGVVMQSPLFGAIIALMLISFSQQIRERIPTLILFCTLVLLPTLEATLSDHLTWSKSSARELMMAQYDMCDARCQAKLELRWEMKQNTKDPVLHYTYGVLLFQQGRISALLAQPELSPSAIATWPPELQAYGLNLIGTAHTSQAKHEAALEPLLKASSTLAPAHFNLMRLGQLKESDALSDKHLKLALLQEGEEVSNRLNLANQNLNSYFMVPPLPQEMFWQAHIDQRKTSPPLPLISSAWPYLAGPLLSLGLAPYLGGLGLLLLMVGGLMTLRHQISTVCPSCGLARSPKDAEKTNNHPHCISCHTHAFSGGSLSYEERTSYDDKLNRLRGMQSVLRRVFSIFAPGTGHLLAGWGTLGFLTLFSFTWTVFHLAMAKSNKWHAANDLFFNHWPDFYLTAILLGVPPLILGFYTASKDIRQAPPNLATPKRPAEHDEDMPQEMP